MTDEQNGPVKPGRRRRFTFGKQAPAPKSEPQTAKFGLVEVITGIAVALALLVGGTLAVSGFIGNANGGTQQQPVAYCVDQFGNPAPPGACR